MIIFVIAMYGYDRSLQDVQGSLEFIGSNWRYTDKTHFWLIVRKSPNKHFDVAFTSKTHEKYQKC